MGESDSFISEVSEEVRRDRFFGFLRRWGWLIGAVILLLVGGAAANEWRKARAAAAAEAAGDALRDTLREDDPAARADGLRGLGTENPQAAPLTRLAEAATLAEAGDMAAADAILSEAVTKQGAGELYTALAALQRVMLLGDELDMSERLATLESLAQREAPFRLLALEQRALARLEAGDRPGAYEDLENIIAEPAATEALIARARQLLVAAGGALPLPGSGGAELPPAPADG